MHVDQLTLTVGTVRELIGAQFPHWAELPGRAVASSGTVNAIFRIGDALAARFPLRPADATATRRLLEAEAAATRELLGRTRFPTPEPVAIGAAGAGYPLPWSVQTWLPGAVATEDDPGGSIGFAGDLADFVREVRSVDTRGRTFAGTNRGGDLRSRDDWVAECCERSEGLLDVAWLRRTWRELRDLPRLAPDACSSPRGGWPACSTSAGGRRTLARLAAHPAVLIAT